jgi:hypothetical protein
MGVKLSVGLQKKVGLPEFGSYCASCHVEFEVDRCLIENDLDGFHQKVSDAFVACRQAVNDQLALANQADVEVKRAAPDNRQGRNGYSVASKPNGNASSNEQPQRPDVGTITQSQLRAIHAISRRSSLDAASLLRERFKADRFESLSIREASELIDHLKRGLTEVRV